MTTTRLSSDENDDEQRCEYDLVDKTPTIVANSVAATIFFTAFCIAGYILVKFILMKSGCEQKSMIVFYVISMLDLMTKVGFFIASCFLDQKNEVIFTLAALSTMASVGSGVSHSQNLMKLIEDLQAVSVYDLK